MKSIPFLKQLSVYALSLSFTAIALSSCSGDDNNQNQEAAAQEQAVQTAPAPQPEEVEVQEPDTAQMAQAEEQPATPSRRITSAPPMEKPMYQAQDINYKDLDANGNGVLSRTEFYSGFYKAWDENGNSSIEENEFIASADKFFNKNNYSNYGDFSSWDGDSDSKISMEEFRKGMNSVTGDKMNAERLVTAWDLDNDDKIERVELDNITVMLDKDDN